MKFKQGDFVLHKPYDKWNLFKVHSVTVSRFIYYLIHYETKKDEDGEWIVKDQGLDTTNEFIDVLDHQGIKVTKDNIDSIVMLYL